VAVSVQNARFEDRTRRAGTVRNNLLAIMVRIVKQDVRESNKLSRAHRLGLAEESECH
jgi:hypothetical protein